jgi:hypothetical protein
MHSSIPRKRTVPAARRRDSATEVLQTYTHRANGAAFRGLHEL